MLVESPLGPAPPGLDGLVTVLSYDARARALVAGVKYRNRRDALDWCAGAIAARLDSAIDAVTWAPTTRARRKARGFDHAELLARRVASAAGLACRPLLYRLDDIAQTGRSQEARWDGPQFGVRRGRVPAAVLIVDDVVTTGATLARAARALRGAGAATVIGAAVARTPSRADRAKG
jgi:predicted amidophosphoribosyltransferase